MSQAQPNQGTGDWLGPDGARPDAARPGSDSLVLGPLNEHETEQPAASDPPIDARSDFDLSTVVRAHESRLLRYVGSIIGHGDGAHDVVQEVFLRLHRHVLFNGEASIGHVPAWLCKAAHNLAIDALRKSKRDHDVVRHAISESGGGERIDRDKGAMAAMENKEACDHALLALESLPPDLRGLVMLKIDQGLTMRQIAEVTGMTPGNVGYRIGQALSAMATRLKRQGVV